MSDDHDDKPVRPELAELRARLAATTDAARPEAVARRRATQQRTARENIDDLVDPGSFIEYGALALAAQRQRLPPEELVRASPADGLICGLGTVNAARFGEERARAMVLAYDYTVFAGTQGGMSHKKLDRMLALAAQHRLPVVLFAEGGGGRPNDTDLPIVAGLDIRLHPPVLLFVIATAAVASLISGAIPAYQSSRADINEILKDESRGASSFRIGRLSRGLVIFEIALSCGLLVASGLMVRSVVKLRTMNPGVATANIFTARIGFPTTYTDTTAQIQFFDELARRLATLPSVQGVSLSSQLPAVGGNGSNVAIEGKAYATDRDYTSTQTLSVSPGFFDTFRVTPIQGRPFTVDDRTESLPVVIVNQSFVRKNLGSEDPIGRRIRLGGPKSTAPWLTIVGVIPDIFTGDTGRPRDAGVLLPLSQNRSSFLSVAVRAPNAMSLTPSVRSAASSLNADIPIYNVYAMDQAIARNVWHVRVFGGLFMVFGVAALLLAAIGLYAVMAFSVSRRAREVGIRIALGARTTHVLRLVFRAGLIQLGVGMTIGLGFAALVSQLVAGVLFDVQPRDPVTFAMVVGVLSAAGLLACYVPARRAARVDPLSAMRAE